MTFASRCTALAATTALATLTLPLGQLPAQATDTVEGPAAPIVAVIGTLGEDRVTALTVDEHLTELTLEGLDEDHISETVVSADGAWVAYVADAEPAVRAFSTDTGETVGLDKLAKLGNRDPHLAFSGADILVSLAPRLLVPGPDNPEALIPADVDAMKLTWKGYRWNPDTGAVAPTAAQQPHVENYLAGTASGMFSTVPGYGVVARTDAETLETTTWATGQVLLGGNGAVSPDETHVVVRHLPGTAVLEPAKETGKPEKPADTMPPLPELSTTEDVSKDGDGPATEAELKALQDAEDGIVPELDPTLLAPVIPADTGQSAALLFVDVSDDKAASEEYSIDATRVLGWTEDGVYVIADGDVVRVDPSSGSTTQIAAESTSGELTESNTAAKDETLSTTVWVLLSMLGMVAAAAITLVAVRSRHIDARRGEHRNDKS